MTLRALTTDNMESVRQWRSEVQETLRTPYLLTEEMQRKYYEEVICDRRGTTRYFGFWIPEEPPEDKWDWERFIGYGGIENIQWENRAGEISILIGPTHRGKGFGREAAKRILCTAFKTLNLHAVWGECYYSSPAVVFWQNLIAEYKGFGVDLPHRKYWAGAFWPSYYFTFYRENHV